MTEKEPLAEMIILDVMTRWPQTAKVFRRHKMACVGCPVSPFCTVNDGIKVHGLSAEAFLAELKRVIKPDRSQG